MKKSQGVKVVIPELDIREKNLQIYLSTISRKKDVWKGSEMPKKQDCFLQSKTKKDEIDFVLSSP